jgi:hypothetical protein
MEDIHEQVWIYMEGDGYIIWGKGLHGENVFAGGDVYSTIFDDFTRINENGRYQKNYLYQFCYCIIMFI